MNSVLTALGLKTPKPINQEPMTVLSMEQLLPQNPDWLLVAHYRDESVIKLCKSDPLWALMNAAQQHHVRAVDSNTWAHARGIFAAEKIANEIVSIFATP